MSVKTHSTMKKQYNNKIPGCFHPGFIFVLMSDSLHIILL